jgi:tRNA threonylcarbamoyladenosine biosynthesis protein TsaE
MQIISSAEEMENFGGRLANACNSGCIFYLNGDLGVGKTTLTRGFLRALGYTGKVKSPTYTLVEDYSVAERMIYHFDLYRLGDPEELEYIGIRDYLDDEAICLIEWSEKGKPFIPKADVEVQISYDGEARLLELLACSEIGKKFL